MAERDKAAAVVAGAAGGSLITYFLTRAAEARAAPPPGMDQETWDLLVSMLEASAAQQQQIEQLVNAINNLTVTLGGAPPAVAEDPFANQPKFIVGQVICVIAGQGFQLPPMPIPKNKQLVVKALPGNVGWIWVAQVQADSQNMNVAYPLVPNEGIGLFVQNADRVWVMAPTVNDGIAFVVEQG